MFNKDKHNNKAFTIIELVVVIVVIGVFVLFGLSRLLRYVQNPN